jgi:hypothetical protein
MRRGQVTVEVALSAAGIVVLAFMAGKVAVWLNQSLVQRNDQYQASRVAAGQPGAGLVPVGTVEPITLISPGGSSSGGAGAQPPSSYPVCTAGFGDIVHAANDRRDAGNFMRFASALQQAIMTEANKVRGLLEAAQTMRAEAKRLREEAIFLRQVAANLRQDAAELRSGVPALREEARLLLEAAAAARELARNVRIMAFFEPDPIRRQALLDYADALDAWAADREATAALLNQAADNAEAVASQLEWYAAVYEQRAVDNERAADLLEAYAAAYEKAARDANEQAKTWSQDLERTVVPNMHQRLLHAEEDERQSIVKCARQ